ncbi:hypothetical protein [Streptomyces sp. NRRL S-350]|uniref:hypothetical protein n=1 Tax=Streptomyces sp. NRRL S-350 TaxID=1463902 RepID=UPI00131E8D34|nr:hypothetical protein [Streptomyces sp. NRRL S-350]
MSQSTDHSGSHDHPEGAHAAHRAAGCRLCAPLRHPSQQPARAALSALPRQTRKGGR